MANHRNNSGEANTHHTLGDAASGNTGKDTINISMPSNFSPAEVVILTREDGKTSIITGNQRDETSHNITGPHSHTVLENGEVVFRRDTDGTEWRNQETKKS